MVFFKIYRTQLTAKFRRDKFFINHDYFCLDYRSCKLRIKLDIVSVRRRFNLYYSTHSLPYLPVRHVEYSLRCGQCPVRLYRYFRIFLANCCIEGCRYSVFQLSMYCYTFLELYLQHSLSLQEKILGGIILKVLGSVVQGA